MTHLPTYQDFLDQHPDLWPHLDRQIAYEVFIDEQIAYEAFIDELRDRESHEAHEAQETELERAEIMERCLEDDEAEDRVRNPEFYARRTPRSPYRETADDDADTELDAEQPGQGVFHG